MSPNFKYALKWLPAMVILANLVFGGLTVPVGVIFNIIPWLPTSFGLFMWLAFLPAFMIGYL